MDIIICPIFINNIDISQDLSMVYLENNNIGISLANFYQNISLYNSINNIYILLNSAQINIWQNIELPPLPQDKINLALSNLLAEDLLDINNIYAYDKKSKHALAVNLQLFGKIITQFNNFKSKNIHIFPLAKFLPLNTGIIQSYFDDKLSSNINIYTINTANISNYGFSLLDVNQELLNKLSANIPFITSNNLPLEYIWEQIKRKYLLYMGLNLNKPNNPNNYSYLFKYINKPIAYITCATITLHVILLQSIVIWQNHKIKQKHQEIKQIFSSIVPYQPMLDPILQLQKLQTGQKQDTALSKLDSIAFILNSHINIIHSIEYHNNWQIKFNENINKQVLELIENQLRSINLKMIKLDNNDKWEIIS